MTPELQLEGQDFAVQDAGLHVNPHVHHSHLGRTAARLYRNLVTALEAVIRIEAQEQLRLAGRERIGLEKLCIHERQLTVMRSEPKAGALGYS